MALINCPECGREVSDQAPSCPHCGVPIAPASEAFKTLVDQFNTSTDAIEHKTSHAKKWKKIIAIIAIAVLVITGSIFGLRWYTIEKEAEVAALARAEYIKNLNSIVPTMLDGAAKSESLCNLTYKVWYNTIYEKSDSETDQYTGSGGTFYSNFNTSISMLYSADSTINDVSYIINNQNDVKELMKLLANPTDEFAECYETLSAMYDVYYGFTSLAIDPGRRSLNTYSEDFRTYDDDFMSYYNRIEILMPDDQLEDTSGNNPAILESDSSINGVESNASEDTRELLEPTSRQLSYVPDNQFSPVDKIIFSTPGEENGLSDTGMYASGTLGDPVTKDGSTMTPLVTDAGTIWLGEDPEIEIPSELTSGTYARIYFSYLGWSSVLDGPAGIYIEYE